MLTVRSAAKVQPVNWPAAGCDTDPVCSKRITKLPAPNTAAGKSTRVFGVTLLICVPFTTRFLNADPAALNDALKPLAFAVATPRIASAVIRPFITFTPADSARPVSVAVLVAGSTVLVLDALSTLALSSG